MGKGADGAKVAARMVCMKRECCFRTVFSCFLADCVVLFMGRDVIKSVKHLKFRERCAIFARFFTRKV